MKTLMCLLPIVMLVTVGADQIHLSKQQLFRDARKNCHPLNQSNLNKCKKEFDLAKGDVIKLKSMDNSEGKKMYKAQAKRILTALNKCKLSTRPKLQQCAKVYIEGKLKEAIRIKEQQNQMKQKKQQAQKEQKKVAPKRTEIQKNERSRIAKNIMKTTNGQQILEMIQRLVKEAVAVAVKREVEVTRQKMIEVAKAVAKEEAVKIARIEAQFVAKEEALRVANVEIVAIQRDNALRIKSQDLAYERKEKEARAAAIEEISGLRTDMQEEIERISAADQLTREAREAATNEALRVARETAVKVAREVVTRYVDELKNKAMTGKTEIAILEPKTTSTFIEELGSTAVPVVVKVVVASAEIEPVEVTTEKRPVMSKAAVEETSEVDPTETIETVLEETAEVVPEEVLETRGPVTLEITATNTTNEPLILEVLDEIVKTEQTLVLADLRSHK